MMPVYEPSHVKICKLFIEPPSVLLISKEVSSMYRFQENYQVSYPILG